MTPAEMMQWGGLITGWIGYGIYIHVLQKRINSIQQQYDALSIAYKTSLKLIMAEKERKNQHAKAFKRLTDPDAILEDMERGAQIVEMRNANRSSVPREDAGPAAKIYTPQLRAKVSKSSYKKNKN